MAGRREPAADLLAAAPSSSMITTPGRNRQYAPRMIADDADAATRRRNRPMTITDVRVQRDGRTAKSRGRVGDSGRTATRPLPASNRGPSHDEPESGYGTPMQHGRPRSRGYLVPPNAFARAGDEPLLAEATRVCRGELGPLQGLEPVSEHDTDEAVLNHYIACHVAHRISPAFRRRLHDDRLRLRLWLGRPGRSRVQCIT